MDPFEESGLRFTPPGEACFRFAECATYRRLNGQQMSEMDVGYWDELQSCFSWPAKGGDDGAHTTAFYVGDLAACSGGPHPGNLPMALWGGADCYAINKSGGFGGFTYSRPANGDKGWVNQGYNGNPWDVYYR